VAGGGRDVRRQNVKSARFFHSAAALLLAAALAPASAGAKGVEYVEEKADSVAAGPEVAVTVANASGDVSVRTWTRNMVVVRARKEIRAQSMEDARDYARDLTVSLRSDGRSGVSIETRYPDWGGHRGFLRFFVSKAPVGVVNYDVTVPEGARLSVSGTSGDAEVVGMTGSVAVTLTSGGVDIRDCRCPVEAATTSGDIDVGSVRADVDLSATSGAVSVIDVRGCVVAGVTSGDVHCQDVDGDLTLNGSSSQISAVNCRGAVEIGSSTGDIEISGHRGAVRVATSEGYVNAEIVDLEGGSCEITTSNGDVDLALGPRGSYEFIIDTVDGQIDVSMPEEMEMIASSHSLRAKYLGGRFSVTVSTVTGDVYVEGL
jgi:DUF4097 and DUF4098 domain-containing protein YvlB